MSDPSQVWPPKPTSANAGSVPPDGARLNCPKCKRKLLTQASVFCNWCGERIEDEEYQARAAEARQSRDQADKAQLEAEMQEEQLYGVLGRLKRRAKSGNNNPGPLF